MPEIPQGKINKEPIINKIVDGTKDEIWSHINQFISNAMIKVNEEKSEWLDGAYMYNKRIFDTQDSKVKRYNPILMYSIVQRIKAGLQLAPYKLKIPEGDAVLRQITRDLISQQMRQSGLINELRSEDKGGLSWSLLGNVILWWSAQPEERIKKGTVIKFQTVRLSRAFFNASSTRIRDYDGTPDSDECIIILERTYNQMLEKYPVGKEKRKEGQYTGFEFDWGNIPLSIDQDDDKIQKSIQEEEEKDKITDEMHFYSLKRGIYQVRVGRSATLVEQYDDNDQDLPDFPYKLKDIDPKGENYLPVELLKLFPVIGEIYGKGCYHLYKRIVENDTIFRNIVLQAIEPNLNPDKFIQISSKRYKTFQRHVEMSRELRAVEGQDTYIPLSENEKIITGDFRTQQVTSDFERITQDNTNILKQTGISIEDIDRPASESATQTAAEERAKSRTPKEISIVNAGASAFLTRVILQFCKDKLKKTNKAPISTNVRVKIKEFDENVAAQAEQMRSEGQNEEKIRAFILENTRDSKEEKELEGITMGNWKEAIENKDIYVEEDDSGWDNKSLLISTLREALAISAGTPTQIIIVQQILAAMGIEVSAQDLIPAPELTDQANAQAGLTQAQASQETAVQAVQERQAVSGTPKTLLG